MQSSTGQYSTQAGEPAQPVQHSVMTANSFGFFLRAVEMPVDLGSNLSSSGTMPTARVSAGMPWIITQPSALGTRHLAPATGPALGYGFALESATYVSRNQSVSRLKSDTKLPIETAG